MEKTKANQPSRTLRRVTSAILAVAFLGFVFTTFVVTLVNHHDDLHKSIQMTPQMKETLPEHPTRFDRLAARINGFTGCISEVMWHKTELGYINSGFQYALGKRMINTGSQNMITLTTGHLYDLSPYKSLVSGAEDIIELRNTTLKDYPFLFVYEHPTLYDPAMMPEGYDALDHSAEMADEAIGTLREGGIRVLDSRDVLPNCGYDLNDLLMVTDQHWSTLSAIVMGQSILGELNDMTGANLDPSRLDIANMNTQVHEKLFIGKYGQRVGPAYVTPDDIVEYWPKYKTNIHRATKRGKEIEEATGEFRVAAPRADQLEPENDQGWTTRAYLYYGLTEPFSILDNPDAPDYTILLLKDSYAAPIGTFMSLAARHVVCVDLRRDVEPLDYWLEKYKPDAVVMAYSLQMLRDDNYDFGG